MSTLLFCLSIVLCSPMKKPILWLHLVMDNEWPLVEQLQTFEKKSTQLCVLSYQWHKFVFFENSKL